MFTTHSELCHETRQDFRKFKSRALQFELTDVRAGGSLDDRAGGRRLLGGQSSNRTDDCVPVGPSRTLRVMIRLLVGYQVGQQLLQVWKVDGFDQMGVAACFP